MTDTTENGLVYEHEIPAREPWSGIIKKGQRFRLIDTCGQQAVDTLFYAAADTAERYSAQDTLQAQAAAYITTGTRLMSNEGNVMLTVTDDSCGRHDTSAGACSCESNTVRFGHHTKFEHACRENFVTEVTRHGMSKRDIVPNINFFMNVPIAPNGDLIIDDGISTPGSYVEMVAEMDVLCVISNCPQINNPCNGFNPTPVGVRIYEGKTA
ncbi:urea carboxylase [Devosia pacifica]|uniref:Urea carboxylase n=1 Tax=Devosia pacifica TaxID=1335967 RepID=A0A918VPW6_9HYPH|nr:urea amidolyase associated protein UAAP2 [Devosia pacifica]GHA13685.1 urea carboxylase [Devosia pacifica]